MMFEWLTVEWLTLAVTVVVAVVTALWALYTWAQQRKRDREQTRDLRENEIEQERKRRAALYVYPFLLACEDLQSRLYNIIEKVGLEPLNKHYPDGRYAEETLYMVAQYFAWQQCIYRYTSYAQDSNVIVLTEAIREDFATDKFGVGPFCFFRSEQKSLGRLVMERNEGELGPEFDVISFHEFKEKVDLHDVVGPVAKQETLTVLKNAKKVDDLSDNVLARLKRIQTHLVELLSYIEQKENVRFFVGKGTARRTLLDQGRQNL